MNLIEALQAEANTAREFILQLDETAQLMGYGETAEANPGLHISKMVTLARIKRIEQAIASGDTVAMVEVAAAEGIGEEEDGE